jgi:CheY-like chemotaxis protein
MARILIVEDNAHQSHLLSMWLKRQGHQVEIATNGREAQDMIRAWPTAGPAADVIVTDVNMPEMNGLELATWIRHDQKMDTPMVVLSSRCDQGHLRREVEKLKARIHPKPFSPSRLVVEIESLLAGTGAG